MALIGSLLAVEPQSTPLEIPYKSLSFNDPSVQNTLEPFFLPADHPMKPILDKIFSSGHPLKDPQTFSDAGFKTLLIKRAAHTRKALWRLAQHQEIPGYLFKVYLDSEKKLKKNEGWQKLASRCKGAAYIRKLIERKKAAAFCCA